MLCIDVILQVLITYSCFANANATIIWYGLMPVTYVFKNVVKYNDLNLYKSKSFEINDIRHL